MNQYIKEIGKKGFVTYKCNDKYIYSAYDPIKEAKKYISTFKKINSYVITCCGADYINSELLKLDIQLIISFEPVEFKQTISSDKLIRVKFINDIENILLQRNIHVSDITILWWQLLIETNPEVYLEPLKKLKDIIQKAAYSTNTAEFYGFLETKNILLNIFSLSNINVLQNNIKKINNPAIIVSSGPSLANNIEFIKEVYNKSYIFALPSSLPYLAHKKIYPDFVIAVDPGYATYYHLIKYNKPIFLITTLNLSPTIFRLKNIMPLIFSYKNFFELMLYQGSQIIQSAAEGSVFINLLRILPQIGFDEAIIIGQDFGYKDNKSHINGGFFEKEFLSWSDYFNPLESFVKKLEESQEKTYIFINEKKIITNFAFKIYYSHFLEKKFDLNILLPDNCYNPISNDIKKISKDYVLSKYPDKIRDEEIISIKSFKLNEKKERIFQLLKSLYNEIKNKKVSEQSKKILYESFIDSDSKKHIDKLLKILRKR